VILQLRPRRHRHRFIGAQPEPVHPGIDMQGRAAAPIGRAHEGVPFGELGRAIDDFVGARILSAMLPYQPVALGAQPVNFGLHPTQQLFG